MRRKNTVEIAGDRRARVSFAVIGAFLLAVSGSVVYTLQQRSDGKRVINPVDDLTETESELQTEIQTAAREALENAGESPVTDPSSNPAGRALAAGEKSNQVFERYAKLRFYLNLERKIADIERVQSNRVDGDDLTIRIGLPRANYTEESLDQAIDRVSLDRTDQASDTPVENVTIGVGDVPIIVSHNGEEVARKNVQLKTTTASAVFDMHERTEEFDQRLDNVERELYGPLYGITYAKGGLERVLGKPVNERFFSNIITLLEMKQFSNFIVKDMQHRTFGTTAHNSDAAGAAGGCLGYYYTARVVGQGFLNEFVPPPNIMCSMTKRSFSTEQRFASGASLSGNLNELVEQKSNETSSMNMGPSETLNTKHTFKRSDVARMAYRNVTGEDFSISEITNGEVDESELEAASEQYEMGENGGSWQGGEFDGQIETVIKDIYTVGSTVRDTRQTGDTLDRSADHHLLETGPIAVTETDEDERRGIEKTVTIELPVTLEETTETSTVEKSVTFTSTVSVGTTASTGETVEERGISQPYTQLSRFYPGYLYQPSFADAKDQPVGVMSPQDRSVGEIENALEDNLNTSNITSKGDFETAVDTAVTTHGTINYTEITTRQERQRLRSWLKSDLEQTHSLVIDKNVEVEADAKQLLTDDSVFSRLAISEETSRELIYRDIEDRYRTVPVKARSELRKRYIDSINWYINSTQKQQNAIQGRIEENMSDGNRSTNLNESFEKAEDASDFRFTEIDQRQDPLYQIDASPDWFTERPKATRAIPQSKPRDEIRQDGEPFKHTSLAMRKVTPLPNPGFPIVPFPPFWVASVNYWNTEVRGEYASFTVKPAPSKTKLTEADTAYVRQPQPVPLEINGLYRTVGRVEPLGFTATNHIIGVMPGLVPMPRGSLGIGDRIDDVPDYFTTCTQSWPEPGPGHNDPGLYGVQGGTCPTSGEWGQMLYQGMNVFKFKKTRNNIEQKTTKWLQDEQNIWERFRGRKDSNLPVGAPVFDIPKADTKINKEMKNSYTEARDLGVETSLEKFGDIAFATQLGMRAYQKQSLCPMETDDEGRQLGCDDDQLEVDVFGGGPEDGDIIVINSERSFRATDRTLVVDTRPGSLSKSAVPQHIRAGLEKGEVSGAVSRVDDNGRFEPLVDYYVKNTEDGYKMRDENDTIATIGSLETNSTMIEATIEVIEPTPDGGTEPPLLYISYTDYSFLIAPGDPSVDWDHVAKQFDDSSKTVDVLMTSQSGYHELTDDLSPQSSILLDQDDDIPGDCDFGSGLTRAYTADNKDHDPTEVYTTDNQESVSYRVSEERWLFGPETAPEIHC